ncbi:MAG TPA: GNAT family N-acetyltransferase [Ktedonosporobacter sp.]|nr:GNAT family N-acetyltransferase [Ktedonosporobacter sp.]
MSQIEVRPAQAGDRDAVLAFCANTWESGDYIDQVWDDWLLNPDGRLFVATVDEQPAGIINMRMLTQEEAWQEGLRVAPQYRQQGLARALNEAAQLEAMRRHATVIRLVIHSENERSIHITESGHMRRVGSFAPHIAPPLEVERRPVQEHTQLATLDDLDEIIDYLNVSNIFPVVGGLYYVGFTARSVTAELLEKGILAGHIYLLRRWDRLDGLAIAEPREERGQKRLSLGYIDGTAIEAISLIAYDLRRRLPELGLDVVRVYAPDLVLVRDALGGIGYQWNSSLFYTYERSLE